MTSRTAPDTARAKLTGRGRVLQLEFRSRGISAIEYAASRPARGVGPDANQTEEHADTNAKLSRRQQNFASRVRGIDGHLSLDSATSDLGR